MRALSLRQPWATLVAVGAKRLETRGWATSYRGPLAIHAAAGLSAQERGLCEGLVAGPRGAAVAAALRAAGYERAGQLPRGALVAVVELRAVVAMRADGEGGVVLEGGLGPVAEAERWFGGYAPGRYAWVLGAARRLREPIPCRGALGLWRLPPGVAARLGSAAEEAAGR
jgi:hypothetical protein